MGLLGFKDPIEGQQERETLCISCYYFSYHFSWLLRAQTCWEENPFFLSFPFMYVLYLYLYSLLLSTELGRHLQEGLNSFLNTTTHEIVPGRTRKKMQGLTN